MVQLSPQVRRLFDAKNFAVLSTLEPDGMPHSTVVWVMRDEADLLFALPKTRRKVANLNRDPRATVVVFDATDPYQSVQVQGAASITDDPDATLIDALSHKYTGWAVSGVRRARPAVVDRPDQGRPRHHQLERLVAVGAAALLQRINSILEELPTPWE